MGTVLAAGAALRGEGVSAVTGDKGADVAGAGEIGADVTGAEVTGS